MKCINCGGFPSSGETCSECGQDPSVLTSAGEAFSSAEKISNLEVAKAEIELRVEELRRAIKKFCDDDEARRHREVEKQSKTSA